MQRFPTAVIHGTSVSCSELTGLVPGVLLICASRDAVLHTLIVTLKELRLLFLSAGHSLLISAMNKAETCGSLDVFNFSNHSLSKNLIVNLN